MMYKVNDIFYSLQGEGRNTGRAAVFIRFAGCNLRCPFCDTQFDDYREMSLADILQVIRSYNARFIVLTGGEPTLQVDELFVDVLHQNGYEVAMETNGTRQAPKNIDWLTVSPKGNTSVIRQCQELKVVFEADTPEVHQHIERLGLQIKADCYYLQPCDVGDTLLTQQITDACIDYIKHHPKWILSLQTHKLAHFK